MTLRRKLILIGLITLVLPWSAWQYLREMEQFLRQAQERGLLATAHAIARDFAASGRLSDTLVKVAPHALYVREASYPITVDGYADDWSAWLSEARRYRPVARKPEGFGVKLNLARHGSFFYALFRVSDRSVVYDQPNGVDAGLSDHLVLALSGSEGEKRFRVSTLAPGWIDAVPMGFGADDGQEFGPIIGEWQETSYGYIVELRMPAKLVSRGFGFAVWDVDNPARRKLETVVGTGSGDDPAAPVALVWRVAVDGQRLAALAPPTGRLWLVDNRGWVLASAGRLYPVGGPNAAPAGQWLRTLAYRYLLRAPLAQPEYRAENAARLGGNEIKAALTGRSATRWQPAPNNSTVVAAAAVPVRVAGKVVGAVVIEQASDALLLLTNEAMGRLIGRTFLAFAAAFVALFAFATLLSVRIRRLRNAAESAVLPDGRVADRFPESRARDELGDLSRSFARVLGSLRDYTDYLRTLSSKLSHELRTPLAVVSSSLENLEQERLSGSATTYARRAREGAQRLSRILRAMSEASRIEESLRTEEPEWFDLRSLVAGCIEGYRDLVADRRLQLSVGAGVYGFFGVPELLVQMLDKLIDNAISFTPQGGWIRIALRQRGKVFELTVANQGSRLPERMQDRLFDSMVSLREGRGGKPHLGLGLYIVRLVAERHQGSVRAQDLPHGDGVAFTVTLIGVEAP